MITVFKDVSKFYGTHLALDHVNFEIEKGEIIGLLGPNGAGKTTAIKALVGLVPIDSGEITLFNENFKKNENSIKKRIGIVPQEIVIFDDLTARENLIFFGQLYGIKGKELNTNVDKVLDLIGLKNYEKKLPKKFSGGMKRRLNIGCALVHKPELLIMDEPTVGIDPQSRNHILESVKELEKKGTTIIYTTHYMDEVQNICSRVLIMDTGSIIANGSVSDLINKLDFEQKTYMEVRNPNQELIEELRNTNGIRNVSLAGSELTLLYEKGDNSLGEIIKKASSFGIESIQNEAPTLEDVFLKLTGKNLRDGGK